MPVTLTDRPSDADLAALLRGEILAGRGVICLDVAGASGRARLYALAREAAYVAGRLGDLAVVDFDALQAERRPDPYAHRLDPSMQSGWRYRTVLSGKRRAPGGRQFARPFGPYDDRPTNPNPLLRPDEVLRRNRIVVLRGHETTIQDTGSWLIEVAADGAKRAKAVPPLVLASQTQLAPAASVLRWESVRARPVPGDPKAPPAFLHAMGSKATFERAAAGAPDAAAWQSLLAGPGAIPMAMTEGPLTVMREGDRTVLHLAHHDGEALRMMFADVSAGGWCHCVCVSVPDGHPGVDARSMLDGTWRAGPEHVGLSVPARLIEHLDYPRPHSDHPWTASPAFRPLFERASAIGDGPLQDACLTAWEPNKLFRRIRAPDGKAAWRRQYALAFPGLSGLLLEPRLARSVDAGEEALPALAQALYVDVPVARRLRGRRDLPFPGRGNSNRDDAEELGRLLGMIGHDRLPRDGRGWDDMVHCLRAGLQALSWSDSYRWVGLDHVVRLVLGIPGRDWTARREALRRAEIRESEINDAQDMCSAYQAVLNALDRDVPLRGVDFIGLGLMAGHGSLVRYVQASRRWHDDPVLAHVAAPEVATTDSWPVPFGRIDMGDGWSVTCLDSYEDLEAEGTHGPDRDGLRGLGHCVATYAGACIFGGSLILSVRRTVAAAEQRVSTAELVSGTPDKGEPFLLGGQPFRLRQHRGQDNDPACPDAQAVLSRLQGMLAGGEVAVDAPAVVPRPVPERRRRDVAYARERLDLWRPYLPRPLARLPADEHVRAARELVRRAPRDRLKDARR